MGRHFSFFWPHKRCQDIFPHFSTRYLRRSQKCIQQLQDVKFTSIIILCRFKTIMGEVSMNQKLLHHTNLSLFLINTSNQDARATCISIWTY
ncbi:hypothetical protein EUGRSUZ_D02394 [Eucalyptus grandis]|uniref:Uncharacterized protein n=1 Tax=Eucalyptus grandis TaxID=71139 RepID=A0A059CJU4_EUCGR|nr:hypothetical protein EUGRSUZ_D02394 [Eucalyptus grandis]